MKSIDTLVDDIYKVISGSGGWTPATTEYFSKSLASVAEDRFSKPREHRGLSLSSLGSPCNRKIQLRVRMPEKAEPHSPELLGTFFYGDLLETVVLTLAKAAGHSVEAEQETVEVFGVPGHMDAIIDGVVVDVKSASSYSFKKFKENKLKENDPFGYISQLSSYLSALQTDPRVKIKNKAAFLAVQKERFKLHLDKYDLSLEVKEKKCEVEAIKVLVDSTTLVDRLEPEPKGESGNMVLSQSCSSCEFRKYCWPDVRVFLYSTGPEYFTEVVNEPRVLELIE